MFVVLPSIGQKVSTVIERSHVFYPIETKPNIQPRQEIMGRNQILFPGSQLYGSNCRDRQEIGTENQVLGDWVRNIGIRMIVFLHRIYSGEFPPPSNDLRFYGIKAKPEIQHGLSMENQDRDEYLRRRELNPLPIFSLQRINLLSKIRVSNSALGSKKVAFFSIFCALQIGGPKTRTLSINIK